jgi:tRNA (guanine-N7-)-methyltransferase
MNFAGQASPVETTMPDPSVQAAPESLLYQPATVVERLNLPGLFPSDQPLEVELGSGDGSFIVQYAAQHPHRNFIAVERLLGRLRKVDRKGRRAGVANLRAVRIEAWYFLEYLLPKSSAAAIHVYFPDPWPKRRHHKNRLVNETFSKSAAQALLPNGVIYLRTDDADYFAQMREVFAVAPAFVETQTPESLCLVPTDFERAFLKRGVQTLRTAYRKAQA